MRILYAEDERALSEAIVDVLTYKNRYSVDAVYDGRSALDYALQSSYDLIILDIMMPRLNGLEVLKELRKEKINTPILLLTAKGEVEDRIAGLDAGADDYLPKPFAMGELLARIKALLRRKENYVGRTLTFSDLTLDLDTFGLSSAVGKVNLTSTEFRLLELFMENPGIYLSADTLLEKVWGYDSEADSSTLWVYLSGLRKKLATLDNKVVLKAKRNIGYALEELT